MTLPSLISFSGYATAGKDAAADILVQRARFAKTHMTKPLELALVELNPWIVDSKENSLERFADLYENLGEFAVKEFSEARRLLRALESEIGVEYWTNKVFHEVKLWMALDKKVSLSGVQTLEELALVREHEGVSVWIERPVKLRRGSGNVTAADCDIIVQNDGTLKALYVNLVTALEEYNSKKEAEES